MKCGKRRWRYLRQFSFRDEIASLTCVEGGIEDDYTAIFVVTHMMTNKLSF
jgi:hypothetical protein